MSPLVRCTYLALEDAGQQRNSPKRPVGGPSVRDYSSERPIKDEDEFGDEVEWGFGTARGQEAEVVVGTYGRSLTGVSPRLYFSQRTARFELTDRRVILQNAP